MDITGATGPVRDTVTIGLPDTIARLRNPQSGTVTIEIAPAPVERTLDRVPVDAARAGAGRRATLTAGAGDARPCEARTRRWLASRPPASSVYADLSGLNPGRYNLPVRYQSSRR